MSNSWQALTNLTQGKAIVVEKVRLEGSQIAIEGPFELPPLAQLTLEDQIFVAAFIRHHGSIKEMENTFGVSYPSIKNRLNKIAAQLDFVEVNPEPSARDILAQLDRSEISVDQALKELQK